mmetsp:Transcript_44419/g.127273  ORF Transcript_44419/g.127273 Transcript_44419/m.127273 type:complete len:360 (-) Transcript_44419:320-1399(-)
MHRLDVIEVRLWYYSRLILKIHGCILVRLSALASAGFVAENLRGNALPIQLDFVQLLQSSLCHLGPLIDDLATGHRRIRAWLREELCHPHRAHRLGEGSEAGLVHLRGEASEEDAATIFVAPGVVATVATRSLLSCSRRRGVAVEATLLPSGPLLVCPPRPFPSPPDIIRFDLSSGLFGFLNPHVHHLARVSDLFKGTRGHDALLVVRREAAEERRAVVAEPLPVRRNEHLHLVCCRIFPRLLTVLQIGSHVLARHSQRNGQVHTIRSLDHLKRHLLLGLEVFAFQQRAVRSQKHQVALEGKRLHMSPTPLLHRGPWLHKPSVHAASADAVCDGELRTRGDNPLIHESSDGAAFASALR